MIKFFKIAISILLISSLLTACTKKPEYYQAAYSEPKQQISKKQQDEINARTLLYEKKQRQDADAGVSKPAKAFIIIVSTPIVLGTLFLMTVVPGKNKM